MKEVKTMRELEVLFEQVTGGVHVARVYVDGEYALETLVTVEDGRVVESQLDVITGYNVKFENVWYERIIARSSQEPYLLNHDEINNLGIIRALIEDSYIEQYGEGLSEV